ncbi:TonB-dependent receptor [Phenylobacterium sp. LjRoot164]|uniref:TonB-dependent receptor domain-containing protein n=1 Tax=unclassified Phenylobacterium TaxID=2640670 RepID=UPI003ECFCD5A
MRSITRGRLIQSTAVAAMLAFASLGAATAAEVTPSPSRFDIAAMPLGDALRAYGRVTGRELLFSEDLVGQRLAPALHGELPPNKALAALLDGSGLSWRTAPDGAIQIVVQDRAPPRDGDAPILGEVVVTGSHIRGGDAIAQVVELSAVDIERGGFLDLGQALRSLPVNFSGGLNPETSVGNVIQDGAGDNSFHASSANLYGLGSGATLVLLNGHRLPVVGSGVAVDLSLVPLAAVDRMEVLADGASAIYGADAVAGVVNIITRRRMEGGEARLRYGGARDGLDTWAGSMIVGGEWRSLSAVAGVERVDQNGLASSKRAASRDHVQPQSLFGDTRRTSYFGSLTLTPSDDVELTADAVYLRRSEDGIQASGLSSINQGSYTLSEYAVHAGLKATLPSDWVLDIAATVNGNTGKYQTLDISRTTGAGTPGDPVRRTNELWSIEANASGSLFSLPAGPVRTAIGAAYREERLRSLVERESAGRQVGSIYGEAEVPLLGADAGVAGVDSLTLSLAARLDDYSDFGSKAVPKLAVLWTLSPELSVRAALARSFRAPSMYELTSDYFVSIVDARDDRSPTGLTRIGYIAGTGRSLGPETADNFNATLTYEPDQIPGLRLTLGYYDVRYHDRLAAPDPTFSYSSNISGAPATLLTRNPAQADVDGLLAGARGYRVYSPNPQTPIAALIDARSTNVAATRMSGFNAGLAYERRLGEGSLQLSWDANYLDRFEERLKPGSPPISRVDTIFSPADLRMRSGLVWSGATWTSAVYWNYVDNYVDNRRAETVKVSDYNTIDFSLTYELGQGHGRALSDVRIVLSATNLFDTSPPQTAPAAITNYRWDPTNASIIGRFLSLELVKSW